MTTTVTPPTTQAEYFDMMLAYKNTALLRTGVELGVFELLSHGDASVTAVAEKLDLAERGARLLLNALAALGLLTSDGIVFGLTPSTQERLVSGKPGYLGDMVKVMTSRWEWDSFGSLSEAVRRGGPVVEEHAETPGYGFWEQMATFASAVAQPTADVAASRIENWAAGRERLHVLDVACGHGLYGYTLAVRHPHARVWSLDWPNVVVQAQRHAARLGLNGRTQTIAGDMFEVPLGGPYDVVLVTNLLHHFSSDRCVALLRRLSAVTADNGRIVLVGFLRQDRPPVEDAAAHLFAVLMLVWTFAGEVHTEGAYQAMLHDAGFGTGRITPVPSLPLSVIVADRKPTSVKSA